ANIEQGQADGKLIRLTTSRQIFIIADINYSHYHRSVDYITSPGIRSYGIPVSYKQLRANETT
ncbi:hypothetical protein ACVGV8_19545, partial [Enterobacter intestinihominis]